MAVVSMEGQSRGLMATDGVGAPAAAEGAGPPAATAATGLLCGAGGAPRRAWGVFFMGGIGCGCGAVWGG
jgi:shikimate 5-dehydrogenase